MPSTAGQNTLPAVSIRVEPTRLGCNIALYAGRSRRVIGAVSDGAP